VDSQGYVEAPPIRLESFTSETLASRQGASPNLFRARPGEQLGNLLGAVRTVSTITPRSALSFQLRTVQSSGEPGKQIELTGFDEMVTTHFLDSAIGDQHRYAGYLSFHNHKHACNDPHQANAAMATYPGHDSLVVLAVRP
jgi:hypothetical protein